MLKIQMLKSRGVTLVEILVVISIIIILTGIVLINYRPGQQQLALQRAANKLAQDIRRAQEMAMSAEECSVCPGGDVPAGGYGIVFDTSWDTKKYRLYAETGGGDDFYTPADTLVGSHIELEQGIFIYQLYITPRNVTPPKVSVNFKPPDPTIAIKHLSGGAAQNEVTVTLCLEGTTCISPNIKTIKVNKAGRIEID